MTALGPANYRPTVVVDPAFRGVADPSGFLLDGVVVPPSGERLLWALPLTAPVAVTGRYQPSHPPEEVCDFGMDFSFIVPYGVGITSGTLSIYSNLANPVAADSDWIKGAVQVRGRAITSWLSGGHGGTDYKFVWTAVDSIGNNWTRTALVLCADTS